MTDEGHATIRRKHGKCPKCNTELEHDFNSGAYVCPKGLRLHAEWLKEIVSKGRKK